MPNRIHEDDGVSLSEKDAIVPRSKSQAGPTSQRSNVATAGSDIELQLCRDLLSDIGRQLAETTTGRGQEFDPFHFRILIARVIVVSRAGGAFS
jgi:hypothetical protein